MGQTKINNEWVKKCYANGKNTNHESPFILMRGSALLI